MKKVLLIAIVGLIFAMPAFAGETTKATYSTPSESFTEFLNTQEFITHTHDVDKDDKKIQMTAEVEAVVFESKEEVVEVSAQARYNFETSRTFIGPKVKINLWKLFKK